MVVNGMSKFGELRVGDMFRYNGDVFSKVGEFTVNSSEVYNSVGLVNHNYGFFTDKAEVELVDIDKEEEQHMESSVVFDERSSKVPIHSIKISDWFMYKDEIYIKMKSDGSGNVAFNVKMGESVKLSPYTFVTQLKVTISYIRV